MSLLPTPLHGKTKELRNDQNAEVGSKSSQLLPLNTASCKLYASVLQPFLWTGTFGSNFDQSWNWASQKFVLWSLRKPEIQGWRPRAGKGFLRGQQPSPHQLEGLGEHCKLHKLGLGQSLSRFGWTLGCRWHRKNTALRNTFQTGITKLWNVLWISFSWKMCIIQHTQHTVRSDYQHCYCTNESSTHYPSRCNSLWVQLNVKFYTVYWRISKAYGPIFLGGRGWLTHLCSNSTLSANWNSLHC